MSPCGICPERERLLRRVNGAIHEHCKALDEVLSLVGTGCESEFRAASDLVAQTTASVKAKMREYQEHCKEHGCG